MVRGNAIQLYGLNLQSMGGTTIGQQQLQWRIKGDKLGVELCPGASDGAAG